MKLNLNAPFIAHLHEPIMATLVLCVTVSVPRGKLNTPCLPQSVCSDNVLTCNTTTNVCQCKRGFTPQLDMCGESCERSFNSLLNLHGTASQGTVNES